MNNNEAVNWIINISADIGKSEHRDLWHYEQALAEIKEMLETAQPEIIHCCECKHWDKTWTNDWAKDYHYCPMIDGVRKVDFYCADAERRTDDLH